MSLMKLGLVVRLVAYVLVGVFYAERLGWVDVAGSIERLGGQATETPGGVQ
jgi:hypothetical protein